MEQTNKSEPSNSETSGPSDAEVSGLSEFEEWTVRRLDSLESRLDFIVKQLAVHEVRLNASTPSLRHCRNPQCGRILGFKETKCEVCKEAQ